VDVHEIEMDTMGGKENVKKNENKEEKKEGEEGGRINDSISSESNADLVLFEKVLKFFWLNRLC